MRKMMFPVFALILVLWCVQSFDVHPIVDSKRERTATGAAIVTSLAWPLPNRDAAQTRYVPDESLRATTLSSLQRAYTLMLSHAVGSNESNPVESGGVLYVTDAHDRVTAVRAITGRILWTYDPHISAALLLPAVNRGVTLGSAGVYLLTTDDRLVLLDEKTGRVRWQVRVADPLQGYFESMAPMIAGTQVIVGSAGGDEGIRGFIAALDATTGKWLWRDYTVPARGQGWMAATGYHGGGAVWTTPAYDVSSHRVYFGTGNPSPDYFGQGRPGPDLYTDAVVSVSVRTGHRIWARQEVSHDVWDYDVASPPLLFTVRGIKVVGEAGKDGYWYEFDAATGRLLMAPVAFVKEHHSPPTATGVREWPGPEGGANYGPSAYDPQTQDVFVAGINGPQTVYAGASSHTIGGADFGTGQNPTNRRDWSGTITAISTVTGHIVWQHHLATPAIGGVTVTAGGTVWFGTEGGSVQALSAATGQTLWQQYAGAPVAMAPTIFRLRGITYVTVVTGGAESMESLYPYSGADRLIAWQIHG